VPAERVRIVRASRSCRFEFSGGPDSHLRLDATCKRNSRAGKWRFRHWVRGLRFASTLPSLGNYYDFFAPFLSKFGIARLAATLVIADRTEQGQN